MVQDYPRCGLKKTIWNFTIWPLARWTMISTKPSSTVYFVLHDLLWAELSDSSFFFCLFQLRCRFWDLAEKYGYSRDDERSHSLTTQSSNIASDSKSVVEVRPKKISKEQRTIVPSSRRNQTDEERHMGLSFKDLQKIFETLDTNKDGSITQGEFIKGLKKHKDIAKMLGDDWQFIVLHNHNGINKFLLLNYRTAFWLPSRP